jgi:hypothetical protein
MRTPRIWRGRDDYCKREFDFCAYRGPWAPLLLTVGATLPIRAISRMWGSPCCAEIIPPVVTIRSNADSILCCPTASFSSVRKRCGDFALRHLRLVKTASRTREGTEI